MSELLIIYKQRLEIFRDVPIGQLGCSGRGMTMSIEDIISLNLQIVNENIIQSTAIKTQSNREESHNGGGEQQGDGSD